MNADAGFNERMNAHQQRLMQFYRASLHAYDGDRDAWARDIREVMRGDGGNPYFRWFVRGVDSRIFHNRHLTDAGHPAKLHRA